MMTVLKTLLAVIAVFIIGVLLFVYSGVYNVAADEPHLRLTRWLLETTRSQSIARRDDEVNVPVDLANAERIRQGAKLYGSMCQMCHLGPGIEPTPLHAGLNPQPPRLAEEMAHHSPENAFWILKHGFKMTGMPAWGETHSDQELWNVVAFLGALPKMAPQQYAELTQGAGHSSH